MASSTQVPAYAVQHAFNGLYFGSGGSKPFYLTRFLSLARAYHIKTRAERIASSLSRRYGTIFIVRGVTVPRAQLVRVRVVGKRWMAVVY